MTTKTLPPHGTYARANGAPGYREPCKCAACHKELRRVRKRYTVNRQNGRPGLTDASPARDHLKTLTHTMTWDQITQATGLHATNLRCIIEGSRTKIRRTTLTRILAVAPQKPAPGKHVDATGPRRRLQALRALGWSSNNIAERMGVSATRIHLICGSGQPTVRQSIAQKVLDVYAELSRTQAPAGCSATQTSRYAAAHGWAPPGAWDEDTIDDPTAHPEWTGHCGTDRGWWTHSLNDIPVCARCEQAHADWKTERAHLSNKERWGEIGKARAAASNRGATIAADARELFGYGVSVEQAAERLGVTRQHLQQELIRHPEPAAEQQAA